MATTIEEMRASYDWQEVFKYAEPSGVEGYTGSVARFTMDDVVRVIASEDGENDGANWVAVLALRDGRWAYLYAGCDYTGWG